MNVNTPEHQHSWGDLAISRPWIYTTRIRAKPHKLHKLVQVATWLTRHVQWFNTHSGISLSSAAQVFSVARLNIWNMEARSSRSAIDPNPDSLRPAVRPENWNQSLILVWHLLHATTQQTPRCQQTEFPYKPIIKAIIWHCVEVRHKLVRFLLGSSKKTCTMENRAYQMAEDLKTKTLRHTNIIYTLSVQYVWCSKTISVNA